MSHAERIARTFPLARFGGEKPPAPGWFGEALAAPFEDNASDVAGARIAWRRWSDAGERGLIFLHGGVAHLSWWDFIAPSFAASHATLALSLAGMGDSDWRKAYQMPVYADEAIAVARDADFFELKQKPILVGHSFGGFVSLTAALERGEELGGIVIIDSPVRPPEKSRRSPPSGLGGRPYASIAEALKRFRLLPDQNCENLYLVDHVARHALTRTEDGEAWRWKFDPKLWVKLNYSRQPPAEWVPRLTCPVAIIRGAESDLVTDQVWAYMGELFGEKTPRITVPGARHHVMLDQPLAFIAALKGLLNAWP